MDGNIDKVREDIERLLEAANHNVGGMVPGVIATWCHKALAALSAEPAQDDGKPESEESRDERLATKQLLGAGCHDECGDLPEEDR